MKCKKCGKENIRVGVKLFFYIPYADYRKVTKKKIRKKDFELWGADWEKSSFTCVDCCYSWGYGYTEVKK